MSALITHDDLTAERLLEELPEDKQQALRRYAVRERITILEAVRRGLLKISDEILASRKPPGPAGTGL